MEDWVHRALKRWPNVPALYGWLRLDRRGRWLIQGETIGRTQIVDVFNRNYAADERGCWYFQNGPQRGYMQLDRAPFIVHAEESTGTLRTHTQLTVEELRSAFLDEAGGFYFDTEHGPAALLDADLDWMLKQMHVADNELTEDALTAALDLPSGSSTNISVSYKGKRIPVQRLNSAAAPEQLGFVLVPTPD